MLDDFHIWMQEHFKKAAPNSPLAKALNYSLKRWASFCRYAEDGISPIDNNAVENAIRPIAIGKKNWLFAGSARVNVRRRFNLYSLPQKQMGLTLMRA